VNTIEPSMSGGNAAFLSMYFDHLLKLLLCHCVCECLCICVYQMTMKDFRLSSTFRHACQGDVEKYCSDSTKKYVFLLIICLPVMYAVSVWYEECLAEYELTQAVVL